MKSEFLNFKKLQAGIIPCLRPLTKSKSVVIFFRKSLEFEKKRIPNRVLTHVSISKDRKMIALDTFSGDKSNVAVGYLETGEKKTFFRTAGIYNHAMFSPTENSLMLLEQDGWTDLYSDEHFVFLNRMWLLDVEKETFEAVIPNSWFAHGSKIAHDFWALDGTLCYIDYDKGAYECDVKTGEHTHMWKRPVCHSHTNYDRSMWVADQTPYQWKDIPCRVIFYDRETNILFGYIELENDEDAKIRGLHAATMLAGRFNPNGNFLRAWSVNNRLGDEVTGYAIIDCMLNLPLFSCVLLSDF